MANANRDDKSLGRASLIAGLALLALGVALLGSGASTTFMSSISPPQFEAVTTIRTQPVGIAQPATNSTASDYFFLHTEFEVLRSEVILNRVITNLDLVHAWSKKVRGGAPTTISGCRELLKEMMNSRIERGTNIIGLLVRSDDRTEAAALANAVADSYLNYREGQRCERETALTNAAQAQLLELDTQIHAAREKEHSFRIGAGVLDTSKPATASARTLSKSDLQIDKESQLVNEEHTLVTLKAMNRQQLREALPVISSDATLISLLQQINQAEFGLSASTPVHDHDNGQPEPGRAGASIDELNRKIDARAAGILLNMETHIAALKDEVQSEESRSEATRQADLQTAEKQRPYYAAVQQVRELENRREDLQTQIGTLFKAAETRTAEILHRAEPPSESVPGNVFLRPILLAAGGLLALAGLVLLIRFSKARLAGS